MSFADGTALRPETRMFAAFVAEAARTAGFNIDAQRGGGRKALAIAAGMSQASVGRMLSGETVPNAQSFRPLAAALKISAVELMVCAGLLDEQDVPVSAAEVDQLRARIAELEEDSSMLNALYAAGVDNWDGYDEACESRG